jgi:hypothetical protein
MIAKLFLLLLNSFLFLWVFDNNTLTSQDAGRIKSNFDSCRLIIYSPFSCQYNIRFDNIGNVNIKEFTNNLAQDSLLSSFTFEINKGDLNHLNELLTTVKSGDTVRSPRMFDTYGYSLFIDNKKYIDVFGENGKINDILRILIRYRKVFNDKCGFFKLFKKAQGSSS